MDPIDLANELDLVELEDDPLQEPLEDHVALLRPNSFPIDVTSDLENSPPSSPQFPALTRFPDDASNASVEDLTLDVPLPPTPPAQVLANEIILQILGHLPVGEKSTLQTLINCQLVSKNFSALSCSRSVWEKHVNHKWKRSSSEPPSGNGGKIHVKAGTNFADEFRRRHQVDTAAKRQMKKIVSAVHGRRALLARMALLGLDAIEFLKSLKRIAEQVEPKFLAVRYWANVAVGIILRARALKTWVLIFQESEVVQTMRAQAAVASFSAFTDHDPQIILDKLDSLDPFDGAGSSLTPNSSLATITEKLWALMEEKKWRPLTHSPTAHFLHILLAPAARYPPPHIEGRPVLTSVATAIILKSLLENLPADYGISAVSFMTNVVPILQIVRTTGKAQHPIQTSYFDFARGRLLRSYEEESLDLRPAHNSFLLSMVSHGLMPMLLPHHMNHISSVYGPPLRAAIFQLDQIVYAIDTSLGILGPQSPNTFAGRIHQLPYDSEMVKAVLGPLLGPEMAKNVDVLGARKDGDRILIHTKPPEMRPSGWVFDIPGRHIGVILGWVSPRPGTAEGDQPIYVVMDSHGDLLHLRREVVHNVRYQSPGSPLEFPLAWGEHFEGRSDPRSWRLLTPSQRQSLQFRDLPTSIDQPTITTLLESSHVQRVRQAQQTRLQRQRDGVVLARVLRVPLNATITVPRNVTVQHLAGGGTMITLPQAAAPGHVAAAPQPPPNQEAQPTVVSVADTPTPAA